MRLFRLTKIAFVAWRHGLDEIAVSGAAATFGSRWLVTLVRLLRFGRKLDAPRGEPDDLKRLPNVNPKLEQRLNDTGVFHFWQIADLDAEMAESLDRALNLRGRLMRDNWVVAAKKLTEESASA